ncbi:MAG: TolC family protein [Magnetococcales bacterium]|nr:TolC family protein [Magnetococcales bacterium]
MFTVGVNNVPVTTPTQFDRFLPSNKMLGVSQRIPSPSARDRRSDSLKNQARLARLKATVRLADLQKEVSSAWVQKKKNAEIREALRWQLKLINQLENWLTGKIEAGASVFGRFSELDVQREQIQEQITALDGEEMVLKADLERLIGEDPVVDAPAVVVKPWHGDDSRFWEVQVAQGEMDVNRTVEKEREAAFAPDYGVGLSWQQREDSPIFKGDDWYSLNVSVTLPLWARNNQQPKLDAARRMVEMTRLRLDDAKRSSRKKYAVALAQMQTAKKMVDVLEKRRQRLAGLLEANRNRYESGEGQQDDVVRPAIDDLKVKVDWIRQKANADLAALTINAMLASGDEP